MPVFSFLLTCVFLYTWFSDVRRAIRFKDSFLSSYVARFTIKSIALIVGSLLVVNLFFGAGLGQSGALTFLFSVLLSGLISYTWYLYLRRLDVYEPERKRMLFFVFALSCVSIFLVFPLTDVVQWAGFKIDGTFINDFLYCWIGIGMTEEFVKVLPVLAILFFTKQIDEPIDYLIYGGMSALGFAFVENTLYLESSGLTALLGRLVYASVAHMFFASLIAYPLAIYRQKTKKKFSLKWLLVGFLLASLAHGFYDFWLITNSIRFPLVTTIFFLGSLHIFTIMGNNLINISNYYTDLLRINRSRLKYDLTFSLLVVVYLGYIFYGLINGSARANNLLLVNAAMHISVVVYIALTFSSINILKGFKAPIKFPLKVFLPKVDGAPNFLGTRLNVEIYAKTSPTELKKQKYILHGSLLKRVVLENDFNWYYFLDEITQKEYLIKPRDFNKSFNLLEPKAVFVVGLFEQSNASKFIFTQKEIRGRTLGYALLAKN